MGKNSAEIYEACQTMFREGQTTEGAVIARDEMLVHQTLLLLEIRDLLANPRIQVEPEPRRRPLRPRLRTAWICKREGKVTFKCVDCRSIVKVAQDSMRGLPGPWIPLTCRRCGREFALDARELEGEIGSMMRAFFPDEPEEVEEEH